MNFMILALTCSCALRTDSLRPLVESGFDAWFGRFVVAPIREVVMAQVGPAPFVIWVLVLGSVFFTVCYGFINLRGFKHGVDLVRGRYDRPEDRGEISHFQAITSALSATIGLGNIAGVAVAIGIGGPGALFWMWVAAFFGMSSKFTSCMFSQVYRDLEPGTGRVLGGPMYYIRQGIPEMIPLLAGPAKVLAVIYALFCMGASLGGGNLFQSNQFYMQLSTTLGLSDSKIFAVATGLTLAFLVGIVVVGGVKRLGRVTSRVVPLMCGIYVLAGLVVMLVHAERIPGVIAEIFGQAFRAESTYGGFIGVLVTGVQRAVFSNEAGVGSAAIVHAAAKTEEPVREGLVAMLGPFIDTMVVCSVTAFTILITGTYRDTSLEGVTMTSTAFASVISWFPLVLTFAILCFAYSTSISWAYYGEQAARYLFGARSVKPFRWCFVLVVALGPLLNLTNVINFSDLMILGMVFPNMFCLVLLSPKGRRLLRDYKCRLKAGEMKVNTEQN